DERGLERAVFAGWSMGGFVVQCLASRAPARVEAMALLSTDGGGRGAVLTEPDVWARLTDSSGTPREQASRLLALPFPPSIAPGIDEQFGDIVAQARAALDPAMLRAQEATMADWHAVEQPLPSAAPPVFVAHGTDDVVIPAANAELVAERWPDSR